MDATRNIEVFLTSDPVRAREAFDELSPRLYRFLRHYLRSFLSSEADLEDASMAALTRLWKYRSSFQFKTEGGWWAFVAKVARNCAFAQLGAPQTSELPDDTPEHEAWALDLAADVAEDRERLYRIADAVWLRIPTELPSAERRRRLLAAQLFYLERTPWEDVCALVGNLNPVDRHVLDSWLLDKSVLLDMAYHRLYWSNDRLAAFVLRPARPLALRELDQLSDNEAPADLDWSREAVRVLVLRYRYGLLSEKIAQLEPGLDRSDIDRWISSAGETLPFARLAEELQNSLQKSRHFPAVFTEAGLWKRLVFQYHSVHELPHRQIHERTEPAARAVGYHLSLGMLNVWLSNGRIFCELAAYVKRESANG